MSSARPRWWNVRVWPPGCCARSKTSTSCAGASRYPAPRPEMPAPTTATLTRELFEQDRPSVVEGDRRDRSAILVRHMDEVLQRRLVIATVRPRTSRISQVVTLLAVAVP